MSNPALQTRSEYMESVRDMLAAGEYVALLESEGKLVRSAEFRQNAFAGYQPTEQDVIVSTYPKSGTNWTMQIAQEIAWFGEAGFEHVDSTIPWPDATVKTPIISVHNRDMALKSPTGLRVIKSHLDADFVPFDPDAKYLSVVRDPKDVIVSSFHFENGFFEKMVGGSPPLDAYVDAFLSDRFIYGRWADHVASWWAMQAHENVLVLAFEEMKANPEAIIKQIAKLMGVELSAEQFKKVAHKSSYAYMKANNHKFSPPTPPDYPTQGKITMIRKGSVGGNISVLSEQQRNAIDDICCRRLEELGSDFPYRRTYSSK